MKSEIKLATQLCPTLCDPVDCSPPGSAVDGILQARMLQWIAISFPRGSSWPRSWTHVSCIAGRVFTVSATRGAQGSLHSVRDAVAVSHGLQPTRLLCPWDSPGRNTGVGCHVLQGNLPSPGIKPGLLHCRWILYQLNYQGNPVWLELMFC